MPVKSIVTRIEDMMSTRSLEIALEMYVRKENQYYKEGSGILHSCNIPYFYQFSNS